MKRLRVAALLIVVALASAPRGVGEQPASASHTWKGTFTRYTLPARPGWPPNGWPSRDYFVYKRKTSMPVKRPLVVFLHGCAQSATQAALGTGWNELADKRNFVVVWPEQSTGLDGSAGRCWNVGQSDVFPREVGEIAAVAEITKAVIATNPIDTRRVYVAGISNGAIMATTMAASYPDLYVAVGSVAGTAYQASDATGALAYNRMGEHARVVPAFLSHGTLDDVVLLPAGETAVSQWVGTNDLADNGVPDNSVSHTPTEVEQVGFPPPPPIFPPAMDTCLRPSNNPCPGVVFGWESYPYTIRRFANVSGSFIVESWLIHGLMHNYPNGNPEGTFTDPTGPDITSAMYHFFLSHAR